MPRDWGESDTPRYCGECIASSGVQVSVTCSGVTLSITRSGVGVSVMCLGVGVCVTPPGFGLRVNAQVLVIASPSVFGVSVTTRVLW